MLTQTRLFFKIHHYARVKYYLLFASIMTVRPYRVFAPTMPIKVQDQLRSEYTIQTWFDTNQFPDVHLGRSRPEAEQWSEGFSVPCAVLKVVGYDTFVHTYIPLSNESDTRYHSLPVEKLICNNLDNQGPWSTAVKILKSNIDLILLSAYNSDIYNHNINGLFTSKSTEGVQAALKAEEADLEARLDRLNKKTKAFATVRESLLGREDLLRAATAKKWA